MSGEGGRLPSLQELEERLNDSEKRQVENAGRAFARLLSILKILRKPGGCPWDRKQTHESLKPYMLEECYEVLAAIDSGRPEELREELGDLLLHVLFQAEISEEDGDWEAAEPMEQISNKLIRRHPHVFAGLEVEGEEEVLRNWEQIKAREKNHDGERKSVLDGVPAQLPSLLRAQRMQEKVAGVGFEWEEIDGAIQKLEEEVGELRDALNRRDREASAMEYGDVLFSLVNVARYLKIHPEDALRQVNDKFQRRFQHVERRLAEEGRELSDASLQEMDRYWDEAKRQERT